MALETLNPERGLTIDPSALQTGYDLTMDEGNVGVLGNTDDDIEARLIPSGRLRSVDVRNLERPGDATGRPPCSDRAT